MKLRMLRASLAAGGIALGLYGYHVLRHDLHSSALNAVASVAVAWTFLAAGIVAWARRPASRMGPLMTVVAFWLLERKLQYSHEPGEFTFGYLFGELGFTAAFAHAVLAYPTGRLRTRFERIFIGAGDGPCVVFGVGARWTHTRRTPEGGMEGRPGYSAYTVDEAALRHGAGVEEETEDPGAAYARFPPMERMPYREGLLPD